MDGRMNRCMSGRMDVLMHVLIGRWIMDGCMNRCIDGWMDVLMNVSMGGLMDG